MQQKELDRKLAARIANSIYYHTCARCMDFICILVIIAAIVFIIVLGAVLPQFF